MIVFTIFGLGSFFGKRAIKGCPFVHFAFRPDAAAMPVDDTLDNGETDTRAFEILGSVKALKNNE